MHNWILFTNVRSKDDKLKYICGSDLLTILSEKEKERDVLQKKTVY